MNKKPNIEILKIKNSEKIVLRGKYSWKIFFNADSGKESRTFSLFFDSFNVNKIGKVFPDSWKVFSNFKFSKRESKNNKLRKYQVEDVEFLKNSKSVAIFNEMRTGKTPTSLFLCKRWLVNRILIICPSVLQNQWQNSVEDWLDLPSYVVSHLSLENRISIYEKFFSQNNLSIVISKDVFKNDYEEFNRVRRKTWNSFNFCAIIDEAHFLRNYNSQQSKSIYSLNDLENKIILTGTPFVNKYSDIFGVLKFLYPNNYSSYWKFVGDYFNVRNVEITKGRKKILIKTILGFKNWECRKKFINEISSFSVRRKQIDILPWLPEIIRNKEMLIMNQEQQEMYDKWLIEKNNSPEKLFNLKSIILFPRYLNKNIKTNGVKIDYLVSFCTENFEKQIVIFSTRSDTFLKPLSLLLSEKKVIFAMIVGKTSQRDRVENIERFQNSKIKVLLCNIQSAGFGLNLSSADTIIFADRSYSPADNDQAEARFLPVSEKHNNKVKLIIDLVCKNTVDEKIIKLLNEKKNISSVMNFEPDLIFGE